MQGASGDAAAVDCWHSPDYQAAMKFRAGNVATADILVIEGYEGPQPG